MTRNRGTSWWAMILSALAGALVAVLVTMQLAHPSVPVRAAAATKAAPAVHHVPSVVFIGDSWTFGQGGTALRGFAVLTAEQLGWQYWNLGVGASGYTQVGFGATFDQRVDRAVALHPDVIVVEGSLNERNSNPQALAAAADATLAHLRSAAAPTTHVLVLGASYTPYTPAPTIDWINAAIATAAKDNGFPFVNPATEHWLDAADPSVWYDPDHPNDVGHQRVADHLEPLLRALVGS